MWLHPKQTIYLHEILYLMLCRIHQPASCLLSIFGPSEVWLKKSYLYHSWKNRLFSISQHYTSIAKYCERLIVKKICLYNLLILFVQTRNLLFFLQYKFFIKLQYTLLTVNRYWNDLVCEVKDSRLQIEHMLLKAICLGHLCSGSIW